MRQITVAWLCRSRALLGIEVDNALAISEQIDCIGGSGLSRCISLLGLLKKSLLRKTIRPPDLFGTCRLPSGGVAWRTASTGRPEATGSKNGGGEPLEVYGCGGEEGLYAHVRKSASDSTREAVPC